MGVPGGGRFDRVVVTVGVTDIAPRWVRQLRSDGLLVAPLWLGPGVQFSTALAPTARSAGACSRMTS